MEIEARKAEQVEWMLNFIRTDLAKLSPAERVKLFYEIEDNILHRRLRSQVGYKGLRDEWEAVHPKWAQSVPALDSQQFLDIATAAQVNIKKALKLVLNNDDLIYYFDDNARFVYYVMSDDQYVNIERVLTNDDIEDAFQVYVLETINGVRKNDIMSCPVCGELYYDQSGKKKYCSKRCGWQFHTRKAREQAKSGEKAEVVKNAPGKTSSSGKRKGN